MSRPRIVFAGTPEFARASLAALVEAGQPPVAVYTQPDRPSGRGRRVTASPVKTCAAEQGIAVVQPTTLKGEDAVNQLTALAPDVLIVAAYGLLLPQAILDIPTQGCLNVHASLLPRWRGAAPIQAAILASDTETGISLMQMTAGLDSGPVYCRAAIDIGSEETAGELHDRLARLGGELLVKELDAILHDRISPVAQDESAATYAAKIRKQDAEIDWSLPATELHRRIRAYNPAPGAFFFSGDGVRVKVWQAELLPEIDAIAGTFVRYDRQGIHVACGEGGLNLQFLQLPGKRRAPAAEFVTQTALQ